MADINREDTAVASKNAASKGAEETLHRSKTSEEYDEALAKNTVTPDGAAASSKGNNPQIATVNASAVPSAPPVPGQPSASPAENTLSTQAEDKMTVGEEIRDREFPVPTQKTTVDTQRVTVDQGLRNPESPRSGEIVGTLPGDHQNVGEAPNIMDQHAQMPDFSAQR